MLSLRNASVFYGSTCAVADISLDAAAGRITCVIGPNGAGKSSLLRAMCGLEPLRAGTIEFDGFPIAGMKPEAIARRA
jgi:ABC-type cobalamin/Fe3+-siderophores transport system ATPase subunit